MKQARFFFLLLIAIGCSIPSTKDKLIQVTYDPSFVFKDSLRLNFIQQAALNSTIIDYKCTAYLDNDSLLLQFSSPVAFNKMHFRFKIHQQAITFNALRNTCLGEFSYTALKCQTIIDRSSFKVGDRINLFFDAQIMPSKMDSITKDSIGIINLKGCLWNLKIWSKDVTSKEKNTEYFKNKRREFFEKAKNPTGINTLDLRGQFTDSIPKEITLFKNLGMKNK